MTDWWICRTEKSSSGSVSKGCSRLYDGSLWVVFLELADFWDKITMDDLKAVEAVARCDPRVIEQCIISGIPKEDMHKVYCDGTQASIWKLSSAYIE